MFYNIDHLTQQEQEMFEATFETMLVAEEAGLWATDLLDEADNLLALAAAADAGYARPLIEEAWATLT